jgi:DNA-binding CsgD family transcriptional regulator
VNDAMNEHNPPIDRATLVRAHIAAGRLGVDDFPGGGPGDEALHARAALELLGEDGPLMDRASTQGAIGLGLAGRHHESIQAVDTFLVEAEEEDDWSARPILLRSLTWMWWCVGDIREASKVARRALQAAEDIGTSEGATRGMGAQIRAAAGGEGEARAWAAEAIESAREFGSWWWELRGRAAVLFLELTLGNEEAAADAAIAVRDLAARAGDAYEPGWIRIHGDMVEGLLGAGRFDEASSMTGWFEARAAVSGHPWSVMVSSRCRGLLAASAGRSSQALTCFDRSLAADERGEMALERGRTLLATGQVLRAGNRRSAARDAFGQARAVFEACGCPPWASRATAELARVSGRVATPSELTGMERRVAELAASGRSNREIAAELFLSVRTVESHLSSAYRKLGIRSRVGLGPALSDPQREA